MNSQEKSKKSDKEFDRKTSLSVAVKTGANKKDPKVIAMKQPAAGKVIKPVAPDKEHLMPERDQFNTKYLKGRHNDPL